MIAPAQPDDFARLTQILSTRRGEHQAITINQLALAAGIASRRQVEHLLESRYRDFPFPLCSGSAGYFIPLTAAEIQHYHASLHSRLKCLAIRMQTLRKAATRAGFSREGRRFVSAPAQPDLPF